MKYISLPISLVLALLAGAMGSLVTFSEIPTWYAHLVQPDIAPPNWVFGPVWTMLYILMGIAAWMVWRIHVYDEGARRAKRAALGVYALQLVCNAWWSIIFFGMHALGLAFVELAVLWVTIATTIRLFARFSRAAAFLLIPYLAWVTFAGYLNFSFWLLN